MTKILTLNTITTAFYPSQSTVPPLGMQNTILLLNNILILQILILDTFLRYFLPYVLSLPLEALSTST